MTESCIKASQAFWHDDAAPTLPISSATDEEMESAKQEEIKRKEKALG
jgi:hypothetical protein